MTFSVNHGAQWPLAQIQTLKYGELVLTGGKMLVAKLPAGAIILRGGVNFVTQDDDGNTNTVTYAIGTDSDPDRFVAALSAVTAASWVPFTIGLGYTNVGGENVYITPSAALDGDSTQGEFHLVLEYILVGRANETQTH